MNVTVTAIAYHRNGISGNGFNVVSFKWRDGRRVRNMVATIFEESGNCAVLDVDETAKGNFEYPQNRWCGDGFEPELRRAIALKDNLERAENAGIKVGPTTDGHAFTWTRHYPEGSPAAYEAGGTFYSLADAAQNACDSFDL